MPAFADLNEQQQLQVSVNQQRQVTEALTIANGAAVTAYFRARGCYALAVDIPATWTAADIAFEVSDDGSTSKGFLRDSTGVIVRLVVNSTVPLGRYVLTPDKGWAIGAGDYVRLVSTNTASEANVNQGGARSLTARLFL